jgi:hypothetical protein
MSVPEKGSGMRDAQESLSAPLYDAYIRDLTAAVNYATSASPSRPREPSWPGDRNLDCHTAFQPRWTSMVADWGSRHAESKYGQFYGFEYGTWTNAEQIIWRDSSFPLAWGIWADHLVPTRPMKTSIRHLIHEPAIDEGAGQQETPRRRRRWAGCPPDGWPGSEWTSPADSSGASRANIRNDVRRVSIADWGISFEPTYEAARPTWRVHIRPAA